MFGLKHKPKNMNPKPSRTDEEDVSDVLEEVEGVEPEDDEEYHGLRGRRKKNPIGVFIGVLVALVIGFVVFNSIMGAVTNTSSVMSSMTGLSPIVTLIPVFLAMAAIVVVASIMLR